MMKIRSVKRCRFRAFSHHHYALWACIVLSLLLTASPAFGFAGGDGSEADPYQVATADHLNDVRKHLDAHFVQTADIDLGVPPWNVGDGWQPTGTGCDPFTGSFNGNGHTIRNLMIDNSTDNRIGLFGATGDGSEIWDLGLVAADITAVGQNFGLDVGVLVGRNQAAISGCYVTGSLTAEIDYRGTLRAGLMIGRNHGDISDSYAEGSVSATNLDHNVSVGGLIGQNGDGDGGDGGDVLNSYASVTVDGKSYDWNVYAGGLIGRKGLGGSGAAGDVIDCYATGNVTADASDGGYAARAGGLIGRVGSSSVNDDGIVSRSYATGRVTAMAGIGSARAGGLIGQNSGWGSINGEVFESYATGDVTIFGGLTGNRAGGLIGVNFSSVYDSYATGHVTGGLRPEIVGGAYSLFAGGLIGQQRMDDEDREVIRCFATGDVTVSDHVGAIDQSDSCGLVAGGLIGRNGGWGGNGATIFDCYARGNVTAQGNADAANNMAAGGLIGISGGRYIDDRERRSGGDVINTYAVGRVVSDDVAGALIAISDNEDDETTTVEHSFADKDVNPGMDLIGSLRGGTTDFSTSRLETTMQMKQQSTFTEVGWDFDNVWRIQENIDYPVFQAQPAQLFDAFDLLSIVIAIGAADQQNALSRTGGGGNQSANSAFWTNGADDQNSVPGTDGRGGIIEEAASVDNAGGPIETDESPDEPEDEKSNTSSTCFINTLTINR